MGVTVSWLNEQKDIILLSVDPKWTWDELVASFRKAATLSQLVPGAVNFILDMEDSNGIPDYHVMSRLYNISQTLPEKRGLVIITGMSTFDAYLMERMVEVFTSIHKTVSLQFLTAPSREEAFAYLEAGALPDN